MVRRWLSPLIIATALLPGFASGADCALDGDDFQLQ